MANPTCRVIITDAIEEARIRSVGDTPSAEEMDRGLARLQSIWNSGVESGLFGRVSEYLASADYEAEEGQRVFSAGYAITLPTTIDDCDSGLRRPRDFAMIQVVNTATDPQISLYDAQEAVWTRIDNLTLAGGCPFGRRYRHQLAAALAVSLSPTFMKSVTDVTAAYAGLLRSALSLRLSAPRREGVGDYM